MPESKVALYLDCAQCVEQKLSPLITRGGLTAEGEVELECARHGHIATFKLDGSDQGFAFECLKNGCEACKKGVAHVH